jgi:hypothetical protein
MYPSFDSVDGIGRPVKLCVRALTLKRFQMLTSFLHESELEPMAAHEFDRAFRAGPRIEQLNRRKYRRAFQARDQRNSGIIEVATVKNDVGPLISTTKSDRLLHRHSRLSPSIIKFSVLSKLTLSSRHGRKVPRLGVWVVLKQSALPGQTIP